MINRAKIAAAAIRTADRVRHTPTVHLSPSDLGLNYPVTLKLECLQHTGSFKTRGAFNRMLAAVLPAAGVIAASGGNHGAAVAYAARELGVTAEIFIPDPTPAMKVERIASYGARVVRGGATYAEALTASRVRLAETGAMEVHAYDHNDVLAGQGTVGREFEADAPVIAVEPEACPTLHDALRAGHPVDAPVGGLAADSLGARRVGALMFPIAQAFVTEAVLVPDPAILEAQRLLWDRFRMIVEPGGATALAALLSHRYRPPPGAHLGVLVCGANTDPMPILIR